MSHEPSPPDRARRPRLPRARLGLRLALMAAALGAGLAFYLFSKPVFYSRAVVRVGDAASAERVREIARELIQPALLERTASRLGVKETASELHRDRLFDIVARPVSTHEIEVEVWTSSPDWARLWTETLVREFVDFQSVRRRKETLDTVRVLDKEMAEIAAKFDGGDGVIFDGTDRAGLARELAEIKRLRDPAREIAPLSQKIDELAGVRTHLLADDVPIAEKLALLAAIERKVGGDVSDWTHGWESLEERRRPLAEFRAAMEFWGIAPMAMQLAIGDEIAELDAKIQAEFDANFHRFDVVYRNLVDRKAALAANAVAPPDAAQNALNLRMRRLAQQIETLGTVNAAQAGDPIFSGMRQLGDRPVSPSFWKIALVSLLSGGVLAFGGPMLMARFGSGRMEVAQIERSLGATALGSIPAIANLSPRTPALANADDARLAPLTEIFSTIREALSEDGNATVALLVTSAMPGEGKTFVAANLGIAFAASGVSTVVVDTDLRRGRLHRLFGYRRAPGLAEVLAGGVDLEMAIRDTPHENLRVLNAGELHARDGNPLASEAFAKTVVALRESCALVIFDAPPVLGLPTVALLAPHIESAIAVVSPGKISRRAAAAALEVLRGAKVKVRGLVLNRAQFSRNS